MTARRVAINAILQDYNVLVEVLEEIDMTTPDEYGTKASGLLHLLEKFNTLFVLKLSYLFFSSSTVITFSPKEEHSNSGCFVSSGSRKGTLQTSKIR